MDLTKKRCVPCEGGTPPLETSKVNELLLELGSDWKLLSATSSDGMKIVREFKFKNFVKNMDFVNKVAELSESEGHHPDLHISYNKLTVELWTHAVGGLSENDFIVAAKIDEIMKNEK